jgi:hypothetical protein
MVSPMTSIYDLFAADCARIAAKTKKRPDKPLFTAGKAMADGGGRTGT